MEGKKVAVVNKKTTASRLERVRSGIFTLSGKLMVFLKIYDAFINTKLEESKKKFFSSRNYDQRNVIKLKMKRAYC